MGSPFLHHPYIVGSRYEVSALVLRSGTAVADSAYQHVAQQQEALGGEEALDESEIANCIINCKWRRASAPSVCGGACTRARARSVCACSDVGVNLLARPQTFRPT